MSVIIYGPQGCGKTGISKVIAEHFGLQHIIDNGFDESGNPWSATDGVPEDTLVLTGEELVGNDMEHYGALDFFAVAEEICFKECREDLGRDLPEVLKMLGKEFSLRDIRSHLRLRIECDFIDNLIEEVLICLGCARLRRSYDDSTRWYLAPACESDTSALEDILKLFVIEQTAQFTTDDVFDAVLPKSKRFRDDRTRAERVLVSLG
nr:hypothetical protein [Nitrosomonas sp.]